MEEKQLVWLDLETTGLDPESDRILEVAAVLTTSDLEVIDDFQRVVKTPRHVLARMNQWCQKTHGENGLAKEASRSESRLGEIEEHLIDWLMVEHRIQPRTAVLAGNTIHFDRRFIARWMPDLHEFLHYRMFDVTSVRELILRTIPGDEDRPFGEKLVGLDRIHGIAQRLCNPDRDEDTHRAYDDCIGAIEEARIYLHFLQDTRRPKRKADNGHPQ